MWYMYTMKHNSVIKRTKIMPFAATGMDLETGIQSEVSQYEKDKANIAYVWNLEKWYR